MTDPSDSPQTELTESAPAKVRYTNAKTVGAEHARATWALAARELLIDAAKSYHSLVTYQELAEFVQRRTLIRTDQLMHYWIGDVLTRVAKDCAQRREPILSALCVNASGSVGAGYASVVHEIRGEVLDQPDVHASHERLDCYRHFGADLPAGGGVPALTPQLEVKRIRSRPRPGSSPRTPATARSPEKPLNLCPVHFTQLPATGVCDDCD